MIKIKKTWIKKHHATQNESCKDHQMRQEITKFKFKNSKFWGYMAKVMTRMRKKWTDKPGVTAVSTSADREGPAPTWVLAYSSTEYEVVGWRPVTVWLCASGDKVTTIALLSALPFRLYNNVYPAHTTTTHYITTVQQSGTVSRISSGTRQSALTLPDVCWRRICLCDIIVHAVH